MPRFENPTVLVTRPKERSDQFVADLTAAAGPFRSVVSPAFELVATDAVVPDFDAAVFTSRAGVAFAPKGRNKAAFCVGDATARAAGLAGYRTFSAKGTSADLVAMILAQNGTGAILHFRGETSVGDIIGAVKSQGISAEEVVVYRKSPQAPDRNILTSVSYESHVILPVFSAETVSIIETWEVDFSLCHVVAMSDAVATAAARLNPASIKVAQSPNQDAVVDATSLLIA